MTMYDDVFAMVIIHMIIRGIIYMSDIIHNITRHYFLPKNDHDNNHQNLISEPLVIEHRNLIPEPLVIEHGHLVPESLDNEEKNQVINRTNQDARSSTIRTRTHPQYRSSHKRPKSMSSDCQNIQSSNTRKNVMIRQFCNDHLIFAPQISLSCYLLYGVNTGIGRLINKLRANNISVKNVDVLNIMYKDAPGQLFITGTIDNFDREDMVVDSIINRLIEKIGLRAKSDSMHLLHNDHSSSLRSIMWYGCDIKDMDICVNDTISTSCSSDLVNKREDIATLSSTPVVSSFLTKKEEIRTTEGYLFQRSSSMLDSMKINKKEKPTKFVCIIYGDRKSMSETLSNIPVNSNNSNGIAHGMDTISGVVSMRLSEVQKIVNTIHRNNNIPYDVLSWTCV